MQSFLSNCCCFWMEHKIHHFECIFVKWGGAEFKWCFFLPLFNLCACFAAMFATCPQRKQERVRSIALLLASSQRKYLSQFLHSALQQDELTVSSSWKRKVLVLTQRGSICLVWISISCKILKWTWAIHRLWVPQFCLCNCVFLSHIALFNNFGSPI